jgi:hypothetical protein
MLIRLKGSGQVVDLIPAQALARVHGGTADFIEEPRAAETTALDPAARRAVMSQQDPPKRKRR